MKTDFDKNIKIDKNIKKEKNIKMDKNMQAENIHKNVDEITINDFVTKNDKDVLELKKHVLSSGSVVPLLHFKKLNELSMIEHCFTTRLGGISTGMFDSLNLPYIACVFCVDPSSHLHPPTLPHCFYCLF